MVKGVTNNLNKKNMFYENVEYDNLFEQMSIYLSKKYNALNSKINNFIILPSRCGRLIVQYVDSNKKKNIIIYKDYNELFLFEGLQEFEYYNFYNELCEDLKAIYSKLIISIHSDYIENEIPCNNSIKNKIKTKKKNMLEIGPWWY